MNNFSGIEEEIKSKFIAIFTSFPRILGITTILLFVFSAGYYFYFFTTIGSEFSHLLTSQDLFSVLLNKSPIVFLYIIINLFVIGIIYNLFFDGETGNLWLFASLLFVSGVLPLAIGLSDIIISDRIDFNSTIVSISGISLIISIISFAIFCSKSWTAGQRFSFLGVFILFYISNISFMFAMWQLQSNLHLNDRNYEIALVEGSVTQEAALLQSLERGVLVSIRGDLNAVAFYPWDRVKSIEKKSTQ